MNKYFIDNITSEEECKKYDHFPQVLPKVKRIIVIGDIHGDMNLLKQLLQKAQVINENNKWVGKSTFVVQVGDQIDSCRPTNLQCSHSETTPNDQPYDKEIIEFMDRLHKSARKRGGAVISLMGNHELMNILGNLDYVSYQNIAEFGKNGQYDDGFINRKKAFGCTGKYGRMLICTHPTSIIIGQNLFVHAGILPKFLKALKVTSQQEIEKINDIIKLWLLGKMNDHYISEIINSTTLSPFWNRILGSIPFGVSTNDELCKKFLDPVLDILQVGKMIIGHTPQFVVNNKGINATCGNKLWRVDTGSSLPFNQFDDTYTKTGNIMAPRQPQLLEIIDDEIFNVIV